MAADERIPVGGDVEEQLRALARRVDELTGQLAALEGGAAVTGEAGRGRNDRSSGVRRRRRGSRRRTCPESAQRLRSRPPHLTTRHPTPA